MEEDQPPAFITGLTSALHLTKWRLPCMANVPSDLLLRKIKATGAGVRCHLVNGSDKYEGSCSPIIKRWEKMEIYHQRLLFQESLLEKACLNEKSLRRFQIIDVLTCSKIISSRRDEMTLLCWEHVSWKLDDWPGSRNPGLVSQTEGCRQKSMQVIYCWKVSAGV